MSEVERQIPYHMGEQARDKSTRQVILEQAIREVTTVKEDSYGKPEDSFKIIAQFWEIYLKYKAPSPDQLGMAFQSITPKDVAMMMILLKVAREMAKHKQDNLVDIAGYSACAAEVAEEEIKLNQELEKKLDEIQLGKI